MKLYMREIVDLCAVITPDKFSSSVRFRIVPDDANDDDDKFIASVRLRFIPVNIVSEEDNLMYL